MHKVFKTDATLRNNELIVAQFHQLENHFLFLLAAGMRDDSLALLFRPVTLALLEGAVIR